MDEICLRYGGNFYENRIEKRISSGNDFLPGSIFTGRMRKKEKPGYYCGEVYYGSFLKAYYGDVWNSDLTGSGEAYGVEFKEEAMEELEKLLLAEKHMADYGVELTDEEKAAITDAAKEFIEENSEETLEVMSATQETVERFLTLYAIQAKVEVGMSADVDTEVSDEEAAQRTVSFVSFSQKTQEEEEASTEADTEEKDTETVTEDITEELTEELTSEAAVTEEDTAKTGAADTEAVTETDTEEETAVERKRKQRAEQKPSWKQ